jgi:NAD(P)-dependent dehydrogenase (short-subunit alcohol dehydrogenase family)
VARKNCDIKEFKADLTIQEQLKPLLGYLEGRASGLDFLIHCAGVMRQQALESARIEDFDLQYSVNVRAPYILTQHLLPLLTAARGQVVFVNSTAGLTAKRPEISQYSATKHALRAIADSLREEVNEKGIRVLSVYLGRTATPMQEAIHQLEGRAYQPETLLQPRDVAAVVLQALLLPPTAEVMDISMRPMWKPQ